MSRWMMDRCSDGDAVHLWEPSCCEASSTTCVPVAVIDFGQAAEVDRLRRLCPGDWCFDQDDQTRVEVNAYLAVALREFANPKPPKPEEPTGLGAVVEDINGVRWVRTLDEPECWIDARIQGDWATYADFEAVRVLSEGVTA